MQIIITILAIWKFFDLLCWFAERAYQAMLKASLLEEVE